MLFRDPDRRKGSRGEDLPLENDGSPDSFRPNGLRPRGVTQSTIIGSSGACVAALCRLRIAVLTR